MLVLVMNPTPQGGGLSEPRFMTSPSGGNPLRSRGDCILCFVLMILERYVFHHLFWSKNSIIIIASNGVTKIG